MRKPELSRVDIENVRELEDLPEGKVLLLGPKMVESDFVSYFTELGREVVPCETVLPNRIEADSRYGKFAVAVIAESVLLAKKEDVERYLLEMNAVLVEDGILIAFFPSEEVLKDGAGTFYSNRDIEHLISKRLMVERIMTLINGARKVVAKKRDS